MTILQQQLTQAAGPVTCNNWKPIDGFRSKQAPTAEGVERLPTKQEITGSSLVAAMHFFCCHALSFAAMHFFFSTKP